MGQRYPVWPTATILSLAAISAFPLFLSGSVPGGANFIASAWQSVLASSLHGIPSLWSPTPIAGVSLNHSLSQSLPLLSWYLPLSLKASLSLNPTDLVRAVLLSQEILLILGCGLLGSTLWNSPWTCVTFTAVVVLLDSWATDPAGGIGWGFSLPLVAYLFYRSGWLKSPSQAALACGVTLAATPWFLDPSTLALFVPIAVGFFWLGGTERSEVERRQAGWLTCGSAIVLVILTLCMLIERRHGIASLLSFKFFPMDKVATFRARLTPGNVMSNPWVWLSCPWMPLAVWGISLARAPRRTLGLFLLGASGLVFFTTSLRDHPGIDWLFIRFSLAIFAGEALDRLAEPVSLRQTQLGVALFTIGALMSVSRFAVAPQATGLLPLAVNGLALVAALRHHIFRRMSHSTWIRSLVLLTVIGAWSLRFHWVNEALWFPHPEAKIRQALVPRMQDWPSPLPPLELVRKVVGSQP